MNNTHLEHRKTSNSRGPGQDCNVRVDTLKLVLCPKCKVLWVGCAHHAPHFNRSLEMVDCSGAAVR